MGNLPNPAFVRYSLSFSFFLSSFLPHLALLFSNTFLFQPSLSPPSPLLSPLSLSPFQFIYGKNETVTEEMMQRNILFKERQRSQSVCTELPYPVQATSIANNGANYTQRIENLTKRTQALREGADPPAVSASLPNIEQQVAITSVKDAIASIEQKSSPTPKGMMDRINQLKQNAASSINVHAIEDSVGYYSSSAPASPASSFTNPSSAGDRSLSDVPPSSSPVNSSMLQKRNSKGDPLGSRKNSGQRSNPNSGEYEPLPKTFSNSKLDINFLKKDDLISKFKSTFLLFSSLFFFSFPSLFPFSFLPSSLLFPFSSLLFPCLSSFFSPLISYAPYYTFPCVAFASLEQRKLFGKNSQPRLFTPYSLSIQSFGTVFVISCSTFVDFIFSFTYL